MYSGGPGFVEDQPPESVGGKGKLGKAPPILTGGAEAFDYDPDDPVDRAALQIAMAHQKRR